MTPAGDAAFARRVEARSAIYSYEDRHLAQLDPQWKALFRADAVAWEFFSKQPAGYRQTAIHLVMSAKARGDQDRGSGETGRGLGGRAPAARVRLDAPVRGRRPGPRSRPTPPTWQFLRGSV